MQSRATLDGQEFCEVLVQVNNVAALQQLPKVNGGEEGCSSDSTRRTFVTGHGFSVCQTVRPVLDWPGAEDCLCGCLVAALQDHPCVCPEFQDHVGHEPEYKHVGTEGTGREDDEIAV